MPGRPPLHRGAPPGVLGALLLGALLSAPLGGCAARPRLLHEERTAPYQGLVERAAAQPEELRLLRVAHDALGPVDVALHVRRAPQGAAQPVLVLQPGVLADAGTWRFVAPLLAPRFDLVLVDPPGTGASGKPDVRHVSSDAYSPTWLAAHTLGALAAFDAGEPARRRYVLVGHSLGGAVVLRMLDDPGLRARHGALLRQVERAVLIGPADLGLSAADERLLAIRDLSDFEASVGQALGVVRRQVEQGVFDSVLDPGRAALVGDAQRLESALCVSATRHAAQAMLRRFLPTDRCGRPDRAAIERLTADERSVSQPLLVLWGEQDDTLPLSGAQGLLERLQTEELRVLASKHSPHVEQVEQTAALIAAFAAGEPLPPGAPPARAASTGPAPTAAAGAR